MQTGFFHHIGSFLLLAATILLIVTCITAPVIHHLSMLKIVVEGSSTSATNPTVALGTFGYCVDGQCSGDHVGYDAASVISGVGSQYQLSDSAADTTNALTRVMILHPIACGLSFISFLLALGAGVLGSLFASLVALLTFLVCLVVLITDFVAFGLVKHAVNHNSTNGTHASYGVGSWTLLAAAICLLLGTIIVFFTCCSARIHRRRSPDAGKY